MSLSPDGTKAIFILNRYTYQILNIPNADAFLINWTTDVKSFTYQYHNLMAVAINGKSAVSYYNNFQRNDGVCFVDLIRINDSYLNWDVINTRSISYNQSAGILNCFFLFSFHGVCNFLFIFYFFIYFFYFLFFYVFIYFYL